MKKTRKNHFSFATWKRFTCLSKSKEAVPFSQVAVTIQFSNIDCKNKDSCLFSSLPFSGFLQIVSKNAYEPIYYAKTIVTTVTYSQNFDWITMKNSPQNISVFANSHSNIVFTMNALLPFIDLNTRPPNSTGIFSAPQICQRNFLEGWTFFRKNTLASAKFLFFLN